MNYRFISILVLLMMCPALLRAQDDGVNTVSFNGFSFSYPAALARKVEIYQFSGDILDADYPGGPQPPYTWFTLYQSEPAPGSVFNLAGEIRVYEATAAYMPAYGFS